MNDCQWAQENDQCIDDCDNCPYNGYEEDEHDQFMTDAEADADVLRSAGMGTDEDYGDFGGTRL